jgi:hypothetical protein
LQEREYWGHYIFYKKQASSSPSHPAENAIQPEDLSRMLSSLLSTASELWFHKALRQWGLVLAMEGKITDHHILSCLMSLQLKLIRGSTSDLLLSMTPFSMPSPHANTVGGQCQAS